MKAIISHSLESKFKEKLNQNLIGELDFTKKVDPKLYTHIFNKLYRSLTNNVLMPIIYEIVQIKQ